MLNIGGSLICLGFLDHPQVQQIETMFLHNCTSAKIKSELPHTQVFAKGQQNIRSSQDPNYLFRSDPQKLSD